MRKTFFLFALLIPCIAFTQRKIESSAEILHELQKLKVVGNVLYLAAHPDDENTRLIAWLENEKKVRAAYLSLTRGDGGQNLIGTEKGDALGVLRTQELLEARNEDGGEQFFSRAKDFGYSKTASETFDKWNKEKVLGDVVWVIRKFQPDVIVTRFPPDERGGHGHHTASAMLAEEAFRLAADPEAYSEQLKYLDPWQSKRLLWNTSVWWDRQLPEKAAQENDYIKIDIGAYNPLLGLSYSEIAADARSQHRSQGFGAARSRGSQIEYLKHTAGQKADSSLFEDIDLSWSRIDGGAELEEQIEKIIEDFEPEKPSESLPALLELYGNIQDLKASVYREQKLKDLRGIILAAGGIFTEALADQYTVSKENLEGDFIIIKRSDIPVQLKQIFLPGDTIVTSKSLELNQAFEKEFRIDADYFQGVSQPYWLSNDYDRTLALHPEHAGNPENRKYKLSYELLFGEQSIHFEEELDYKWTDRAKGELHRDVISAPSLTLTSNEESYLFTDRQSREIKIIAEAHEDSLEAEVSLESTEGWKVEPQKIDISMAEKGQQQNLIFKLSPPEEKSIGEISFMLNGKKARAIQRIEHDHIRPQIIFPQSSIKVVRFDLSARKPKIAYIEGSGDLVDENLRQLGYEVINYSASEILTADLSDFHTILCGIRAYNTEESMKNVNEVMNEFARNGGTVVVQYNTSRGLKSEKIGPYPLELSRDRVTDEYAEVSFLNEKHPILNQPNQISKADFEGWVQERGLYFAGKWDDQYEAILSWNDPGEEPLEGSLLVSDYGKGHFIYTGISFFRQLPAGVPGAYRILANILVYGQERKDYE